MTFATRIEYLEWRTQWRANYKTLTADIRKMKNARKEYLRQYVSRTEKATKMPNPEYSLEASYRVWLLRLRAQEMMVERLGVKKEWLASRTTADE